MKTQEEIKKMAEKFADAVEGSKEGDQSSAFGYKMGYTKCQEDMADKKYTFNQITNAMAIQIANAMAMAREINGKETYYKYSMEEIINSLNKQD